MLIAHFPGNKHDASQSGPDLQPDPRIGLSRLRPIKPKVKYEPPTPISSDNSSSSDCGSSGTCTANVSSHSNPLVPAANRHRNSHSSLFCRKRNQGHASPREAKKCPVCWNRSCQLVSHRLYTSRTKRLQSQPPRTSDKQLQASPTLKARQSQPLGTDDKRPEACLTASLGKAWGDPFFDLPTGISDPEMPRHFRDFFVRQVSSMTSPVRIRAFDEAYCPAMMRQALADPALCHTVIAMAATYSAIHGHGLKVPDAKLLSIYGRTFEVLRHQTGLASQGKQLDSTIMATLNLLMCHGLAFGDKSAMATHPVALRSLVDACGGIYNLNAQPAALCLWADFYITLYTGKRPVFLEQMKIMPDIPLSNPPNAIYGSSWADLETRGLISQTLLDVCLNMCRLTELLEDRVSGNINSARWEYFNYKRNAMAIRNGMVHSELFNSGTKAECISLIHNLFLFLVLRLMPWNAPLVNLCEQLRSALLVSKLHNYWGRDIDVLLWVLFMLIAGADCWDGKQWALELLLETLSHRYKSEQPEWPLEWRETQHLNLLRFTWSDVYLTESFKATCRSLIAMSQSPTRVSARQGTPTYFTSDIF